MEPFRLGLVGLGAVSRYYLAALADVPSLRLTAVCDVDGAASTPWADQVACSTDHRDLLRRGELDALVVATPNDTHARVCADALAAGVAVCVEKPLATDFAEGQRLAELADRYGVTLFTALHRRYNASVWSLARTLPAGTPIRSVVVRYLERIEEHTGGDRWPLDPARCGGGCVADNGPNAYDLARLFVGELEVADAVVERDRHGVDRRAVTRLRARDGATARVELDWSYHGERKDVELHLTDGTVHRADLLAAHPGFKASLWHEYVGVLTHFAGLLSSGGTPNDHGLATLALVDATYRTEGPRRARSAAAVARTPP